MLTAALRSTTDVQRERAVLARWLLVEALLLGTLADATLRASSLGAGWTLWIMGVVATVLVLTRRFLAVTREQVLWIGLAVWNASLFAWRDASMLQFGNFVASLVALAMLSMTMAGGSASSVLVARIRDILRALRTATASMLGGAGILVSREAALGDAAHAMAAERMPAIRAAFITIPIVIVLGKLLGAADPVFARLFQLPDMELGPTISHALFSGIFAWLCAGWMRGLFVAGPVIPRERTVSRIGIVEVSTVLTAVDVLFGLFVGMQLRWLFGGASVVNETTGLSVAAYARSGFFELVTVSALVLPLLLGTRALIEHDEVATQKHRRLALPMVALLGVIMMSAVLRMGLYVQLFGLTTDRVYALVFMGWLSLVFAWMAVTVLRGRVRRFAAFTVLSAYAVLGLLNIANPEALVARFELGRSRSTRPVDWEYLARLSGDAASIVAPALASAAPGAASCSAAGILRTRFGQELPFELAAYNVGFSAAETVVPRTLTLDSLGRLCGSSRTSPSASLSR